MTHTYSNNIIINYSEGDTSLERIRIVHKEDTKDILYTIKEGDTLTSLANRFFKKPKLWFIIADVNEAIINPLELEVGTNIIIPNIEKYEV